MLVIWKRIHLQMWRKKKAQKKIQITFGQAQHIHTKKREVETQRPKTEEEKKESYKENECNVILCVWTEWDVDVLVSMTHIHL